MNRIGTGEIKAAQAAVIRAEMGAQKLTTPELAERSGIPYTTLRRYVEGEREPGMSALYAIAGALGMDVPTIWRLAMDRMASEG